MTTLDLDKSAHRVVVNYVKTVEVPSKSKKLGDLSPLEDENSLVQVLPLTPV